MEDPKIKELLIGPKNFKLLSEALYLSFGEFLELNSWERILIILFLLQLDISFEHRDLVVFVNMFKGISFLDDFLQTFHREAQKGLEAYFSMAIVGNIIDKGRIFLNLFVNEAR